MDKNRGLDISRQQKEEDPENDLVFGSIKEKGLAENIDSEKYLPKGEIQRGIEDFMDCATRGPNNILETKMNYLIGEKLISKENEKWLAQSGYLNSVGDFELSDRFTAIKSGTRRTGNSLKAPVHALHKFGVIPKSMLPKDPKMNWQAYHDPSKITKEMEELGLEFIKRFPINYEKFGVNELPLVLKTDMVDLALYAWGNPIESVYPRVDYGFNHVVMGFTKQLYRIFDNYLDEGKEGDFIKDLASNYQIYPTCYRIIIRETNHKVKVGFNFEAPEGLASKIIAFLKSLGIKL